MAHRTILIVEDEAPIADAVLYALKTEGFETLWASDCQTAREMLGSADLVVLDINLPDGSGFDLLSEIRAGGAMPVLILSSRADLVDRVAGLEMGADDYMVKPFSPRELTARVRAILRRAVEPSRGDPVPVEAGDLPFRIDEHRRVITYFGEPLALSRYEYRVLKLLIGRPGWVFTRNRILELAWDEPEASFDRTIDTHIKNIRARAREIRPDIDPIVTHRGVGYALKEHW